MKNIYIVTVANVHKKTDEEWKQEFQIEKIKYHRWEFYSLKDWKEYLEKNKEVFKSYNYKIDDEIVGYFTNMKDAHKALYENMFDVAECGHIHMQSFKHCPLIHFIQKLPKDYCH